MFTKFLKKERKEWVIVSHYLRKCVVCSITCPTLPKKLPWLLSGVVVCLCVRTSFPLSSVCVFVSPKKKKVVKKHFASSLIN